jgi:protein TonB
MTARSLLASFALHAAALGAACWFVAGERPSQARSGFAIAVHEADPDLAERPPPEPDPPAPSPLPAEAFPDERPAAPEADLPAAEVDHLPETTSFARLAAKLDRPLRRKAPPSPSPRPSAPPAPPPASVRPGGPTRGPSLASMGERPEYPREARRKGLEGSVTLRLLVRADGTVADVQVHASCGHAILDRAAAAAAWTWRFEPALERGRRVERWTERVVTFRLEA